MNDPGCGARAVPAPYSGVVHVPVPGVQIVLYWKAASWSESRPRRGALSSLNASRSLSLNSAPGRVRDQRQARLLHRGRAGVTRARTQAQSECDAMPVAQE